MPVSTVAVEMMVWTDEVTNRSTCEQAKFNPLLQELALEDTISGVYAAVQRLDALRRAFSQLELTEWTRVMPNAMQSEIVPALWKAAAIASLDDGVTGLATEFHFGELQYLALKFTSFAGHA